MKNIWKSLSCYLFPFFTSHPCFFCYCVDRRPGCGWNESKALQSPFSTDGIETNVYVVRKPVRPEIANHTTTCLESFWELLGGFCFSSQRHCFLGISPGFINFLKNGSWYKCLEGNYGPRPGLHVMKMYFRGISTSASAAIPTVKTQ